MNTPLAFILLVLPFVFAQENRYCLLESCPNGSHTLCRFDNQRTADACGATVERGLTSDQMSEILDLHLWARERALVRRLGLEANRRQRQFQMIWDGELTRSAQRWANQCQHRIDQCRHVGRFPVEQKIALLDVVNGELLRALGSIVNHWYDEDHHTANIRPNTNGTSTPRSLWETATHIGCGATKPTGAPNEQLFVVCNFAPVEYPVDFDPDYVW